MEILDKLKGLLTTKPATGESRSLFREAKSISELLGYLDVLLGKNEDEFNGLKEKILKVQAQEQAEVRRVRDGLVEGRLKKYTLKAINRLRKWMGSLDKRMDIHDKNINLHIGLIGKIQEIEAMALKGVSEAKIDDILGEFETQLTNHMVTMEAGEAGEEAIQSVITAEDKELKELEREIKESLEKPAKEEEEEDLEVLEE